MWLKIRIGIIGYLLFLAITIITGYTTITTFDSIVCCILGGVFGLSFKL